jgi:uracil-DNA glycosylase family 4
MSEIQAYLDSAPKVQGQGPLDARVWVIGDKLEAQSILEKKIFAGSSGKFLRDRLAYVNLNEVRFECLVDLRPPDDEFEFFEKNPEAQNYLAQKVSSLKERIKNANPNLVILLGAGPLKYILAKRSVGDWRGHIVWNDELGCKCITTYHPTVCIRQRYFKKKKLSDDTYEYPGQFDALFASDLSKAKKHSFVRELEFPAVTVITNPTFTQVMDEIKYLRENATILSYDIETIGTSLMDCISLSCSITRTISIPFYHVGHNEVYPYWKGDECAQVLLQVKELLESDIPKVAQNSKYDTVFLARNYGIKVRNLVWDTLVAAHNLYCELPKDLGTLISLYTDLPYHKHMMKEDRWTYNALDSSSTLAVMQGQVEEFKQYNISHYKNVTNFAIRPLTEMQLVGINVDLKLREFAIKRESAIMEDIEDAMDCVFPVKVCKDTKKFKGHKFNMASAKAKGWLFYEKFNLRKKFNKGKPTTDDDAMQEWSEHKLHYVAVLAQAISKFQHARTMRSRMETPLDNGRMHSNFDVIGTTTGRLASKETFWGSGTNLQNLKVGVQRQMLIPDDGEEFAVVDLWAAEAYVVAIEAKEDNLLKLLKAKYKIHSWLYDNTFKKWPEECTKLGHDNAKFAYKNFKQLIHLMNYGGEVQKMVKESGLPLLVCEWIYKFYHAAFPRIKARHVDIQNKLQKSRILTSLLGRNRVFLAPYSQDLLNEGYAWPSQSVIGEITVIAMSKLFYSGLVADHLGIAWTFPALNTHDGIAIRCKLGNREAITRMVKDNFNVPLGEGEYRTMVPIEIGWAKNFNDVTDKVVLT